MWKVFLLFLPLSPHISLYPPQEVSQSPTSAAIITRLANASYGLRDIFSTVVYNPTPCCSHCVPHSSPRSGRFSRENASAWIHCGSSALFVAHQRGLGALATQQIRLCLSSILTFLYEGVSLYVFWLVKHLINYDRLL